MDITKEFIVQVGDDLSPIENTPSDVIVITNLINEKDSFDSAFKKLRTLYFEKENKTYIFSNKILFILQKLMIEEIKNSYLRFVNSLNEIEDIETYLNNNQISVARSDSYFISLNGMFPNSEEDYNYYKESIENYNLTLASFSNLHEVVKKLVLDVTNISWCNRILLKYIKGELSYKKENRHISLSNENIENSCRGVWNLIKYYYGENAFLTECLINLAKPTTIVNYGDIIDNISVKENKNIINYNIILKSALESIDLHFNYNISLLPNFVFIHNDVEDNYNNSFLKNKVWDNYDAFLKNTDSINFRNVEIAGSRTVLNIYIFNSLSINRPYTYKRLSKPRATLLNEVDLVNGQKFYIFNENYKGFYKISINYKTGVLQLTPIKNVT